MLNPNFYPTPKKLINKMFSRIKNASNITTILEPSAGNGALIEAYREKFSYHNNRISAIEIDPELRATLIGKNINVIDSDFLKYEGLDKFDLILANFPFSDGEHHLNKALDIMFKGQIVCLVNASTIKNPHTKTRADLVKRLDKLNAKIEFLDGEFSTSESLRKTNVEVALISVVITQNVEDLFDLDIRPEMQKESLKFEEEKGLNHHNEIQAVVARYREDKEILTKQIFDFYKNYNKVSKYIRLNIVGEENRYREEESLTTLMQDKINDVSASLKRNYWRETLTLEGIKSRLTSKNKDVILKNIDNYSKMEFSESNISEFILKIVEAYPRMIEDSILDLFDSITGYALKDERWGSEYKANIHYFNAWKTNNSFKINQKIILPFYRQYSIGVPVLAHKAEGFINDMEKVMSYFTGKRALGTAQERILEAFRSNDTRSIDTEFFIFTFYKKGTVHIKFKDEDLLRRFNIEACKLKKWLPMDYASKDEANLSDEDKTIVEAFEGLKNYSKSSEFTGGRIDGGSLLQLTHEN